MTNEELFEKIESLVGEHVQGYIFIAQVEPDQSNSSDNVVIIKFDGGRALSLGMMEHARAVLQAECVRDHQ